MYYTSEQLEELKGLKAIEHFRTVVNAQYLRNVGRPLSEAIEKIYKEASGDKTNFNLSCRQCVYDLYMRAGKLYFQTLEAMKSEPKAEEKSEPKAEPVVGDLWLWKYPGNDEINIIASDDKPKVKRTVKKTVQK